MDNHQSKKDIDNLIFEILKSSKSLDVFPTPIDKIVEYCELNLSDRNGFHHIPENYIPKKLDAFNRMLKKILGAFDREEKVIYIDPLLPTVKQNFIKLHETGHGVIPWQKEINYIDNEYTLSPAVKEVFESEANYFASGSLFQLKRFEDEMNKLPLEIGSPMALAKKFGGSNHAAIRRYAEVSKKRCCLLVLEDKNKKDSDAILDLRNSFQSSPFTKEFGELTWPKEFNLDFPFTIDYSRKRQFHRDGTIQLLIHGEFIEFSYHYFNNRYNVFVLIIPVGEKNRSKTRIYMSS
jgi:Zn-dependent peptidase ImmA (M78 family)